MRMSEPRIFIRLLTDVFSTELGIRPCFVKISEFREKGLNPATPSRYATGSRDVCLIFETGCSRMQVRN
jgi:hypothetical protein